MQLLIKYILFVSIIVVVLFHNSINGTVTWEGQVIFGIYETRFLSPVSLKKGKKLYIKHFV